MRQNLIKDQIALSVTYVKLKIFHFTRKRVVCYFVFISNSLREVSSDLDTYKHTLQQPNLLVDGLNGIMVW